MLTQERHNHQVALLLFLGLWLWLGYSPLWSAITIWYGNDIFNHCFFVIPASLYFIWEKRQQLNWKAPNPSALALVCIFSQLLLLNLGAAGDIQLFQHVAVFSLLPTLIWFWLGNQNAYRILFPLCFMLFAIPFGEELIPFLQEITADISVALLRLTGLPLYRSGLFIEIPQGRFLVAEACSGVSFLIASFVLGNLFAYMNFSSTRRKLVFVAISLGLPIIANALRVYGIIFIAYKTDMEYAAGADHLIYGWFFFAFVIICLLLVGEWMRRCEPVMHKTANSQTSNSVKPEMASKPMAKSTVVQYVLLLIVSISAGLYYKQLLHKPSTEFVLSPFTLSYESSSANELGQWSPLFFNAGMENLNYYRFENDIDIAVYYASYQPANGELISSLNRLYNPKVWSLAEATTAEFDNQQLAELVLSSANGETLYIYPFYILNGKAFHSRNAAKLFEIWQNLTTRIGVNAVIIMATNKSLLTDEQHNVILNVVHSAAQHTVSEASNDR